MGKSVSLLSSLIIIFFLCLSEANASNFKQFFSSSGSSGPTWAGYTTSTYDGSMGGTLGMNAKCDTDYSGSHACTWDEIIKLGASYPKTSTAWVIDGTDNSVSYESTTARMVTATKDGSTYYYQLAPLCSGWSNNTNSATVQGPYISTLGKLGLTVCSAAYKIPCCK